ncbi:ASHR1, partial [Symbiodinium microadriaticum]
MEREQSFCGDDVMCRANGKVDGEEMANVKSSKMKGKKKKKKNKAELTPGIYTNSFFTIKVSKVVGRVAVAARSIERGTSILVEEPFCLASSHMTLCPGCGRFGDHNNVTASDDTDSVISYCSLKCMESNGADCVEPIMHCLREAAAAFHCDLLLLVITYKILCRIRRDEPDKEMMPLFIERNGHVISTIAGFLAQVDHVQEQSEEWKFAVRSALAFVLDTQNLYPGSSLDDSTLAFAVAVASRVNMNSYGIVRHLIEEPTPAIGVGVFPIAAVSFNHSCSPNIVNVFVNGKMEYRALCDISSGDELCVSYIDCTSGTVARRNILSESRFFHCACRRCSRFDMIMSSSGAQCSDNLEELDTITQDTSAICDVMLAGLHCPTCGPAGVVIISSLNGSVGSGHSKLCWCLLCKQK